MAKRSLLAGLTQMDPMWALPQLPTMSFCGYAPVMRRFLMSVVVMLGAIGASQPLVYFTTDEMEGKSPAELGDLVLRGEDHGTITQVDYKRNIGPMMPGNEGSILLREAPRRTGDGCMRTSFRASVVVPASDDPERQWVRYSVTNRTEVAWSPDMPCQFANYANIMAPVTPAEGIEKLGQLDAFRNGERPFGCASQVSETYCDDFERVRSGLKSLQAWMILKRTDGATLWLGTPGGLVTWVTLPAKTEKPAFVSQKIPAPF